MDRVAAGQNAKSKMLLNNQRMVHLFAKKYNGMGVPYHDLVSEGMLGLERAVEKFDPDLGFRFSTYAHFWIRNAMVRCLQQEGGLVQIPINTRRQNAKINEAQEALRQRLKREPSVEEIAVEVGISVARVKEVKKVIGHASVSSLDKKFKSSESSDMYDIVAVGALSPWSCHGGRGVRIGMAVAEVEGCVATLSTVTNWHNTLATCSPVCRCWSGCVHHLCWSLPLPPAGTHMRSSLAPPRHPATPASLPQPCAVLPGAAAAARPPLGAPCHTVLLAERGLHDG